MRKLPLLVGIAALTLSFVTSHAGVVVTTNTNFYTAGATGTDYSTVNVGRLDRAEVGGSGTTTVDAQVNYNSGLLGMYEDARGPLTLTFDPLLLTATATGTLVGRYGDVEVDLTYRRTHLNTQPPTIDLEADVFTPRAAATAHQSSMGRVTGTISTAIGTVSFMSAEGYLNGYTTVSAT